MDRKLVSKCPECKSRNTDLQKWGFNFATLGKVGFYISRGWTCLDCNSEFEDPYRCDYMITQTIRKDIENNNLIFLGQDEDQCPICNCTNITTYLDGVCFDLENQSGVNYRRQCKDCHHIYNRSYPCDYRVTQGAEQAPISRGGLSFLEALPRCPSCDDNEIALHHYGLHLDTKDQYGVHLTIQCLECLRVFDEVYKCIYVGTRHLVSEYGDFHARCFNDIEIYLCTKCSFNWTDEYGGEYGDFCPLCKAPEPYPINQGY